MTAKRQVSWEQLRLTLDQLVASGLNEAIDSLDRVELPAEEGVLELLEGDDLNGLGENPSSESHGSSEEDLPF